MANEDKKNTAPTFEDAISKGASTKIGEYKESTGGGTPIPKGEKLADHPEIKRVQQPRDENGQFTYNSANRKPLEYGPSRGTTIPPFLRSHELVAVVKSDTPINYDGMIYLSGINMDKEKLIQTCKDYNAMEAAEFNKRLEAKKGRKSQLEKTFIEQGKETFATYDIAKKLVASASLSVSEVFGEGVDKYKENFKKASKARKDKILSFYDYAPDVQKDLSTTLLGNKPKTKSSESGAPKSNDFSSYNDNPKEFVEKNKDKISSLMTKLKEKTGGDYTPSQLLSIAADPQNGISSFKDLEELIDNI